MDTLPNRALELFNLLKKYYPDAKCALHYRNPFELLVSTILSAQCTDERVNKVTPLLFERFPTPKDMAQGPLEDIEKLIFSTGFYRNKAKSLMNASQSIQEKYNGIVPDTMESLLKLQGVARKTANVVLGNAYGKNEGIVIDTHVKRLSNRFGLTKHEKNVNMIEKDLMKLFDRDSWTLLAHLLIQHGRNECKAKLKHPSSHPICKQFNSNCKYCSS